MIGLLLERVPQDSIARAHGLFLISMMACSQGDYPEAGRAAEESVRSGRLLSDDEVVSLALITLSSVSWTDQRTRPRYEPGIG